MKQTILPLMVMAALAGTNVSAKVYSVAKSGSADFTTIQKAVDAAKEHDTIFIIDNEVYEEQVTFDSTKRNIILESMVATSLKKPVIRFKDDVNVGPKNITDAREESKITFYKNGTLRFIKAQNIRVEGIVVDGGGALPFGYPCVWEAAEQCWPMQHGNAAVTIVSSGEITVRNCIIRNAFYGFYCTEWGNDGFFCTMNPSDGIVLDPYRNCKPLSSGNHLVECNRIHSNSFGLFFENGLDMGSTVRYNLIYENHHQSEEIIATVKSLTSEGFNLVRGGAFLFKNALLSPIAIYNNTLWHNGFIFDGIWKAGGQHLVFNNIIGKPAVYSSEGSQLEMTKCFANRMHNSVFAAQIQAPTASYISVFNDLAQPKADGDLITGGTKPFPAEAEIRYLETPFLSTDPESPDFLVPDWSNALVNACIVDKGWELSGVKDPDGSRADLGAIPMGKGTFTDVTTIRPAAPAEINGIQAKISFYVEPRRGDLKNGKATLFGLVSDLDTSDVFGNAYKAIPKTRIQSIPLQSYDVVAGIKNTIDITLPQPVRNYAFFEMIIEGTGFSGKKYTTAVGFIPLRESAPNVIIDIMDTGKTKKIDEIEGGVPFTVRVSMYDRIKGTLLEKAAPAVSLYTHSGRPLLASDGTPFDTIPGAVVGIAEFTAQFPVSTTTTVENIIVSGRPQQEVNSVFIGSSANIKVLARDVSVISSRIGHKAASNPLRCEIIDLSGRTVYRGVNKMISPETLVQSVENMFSKGVYILRLTDMIDGTIVLKQRIVTGR